MNLIYNKDTMTILSIILFVIYAYLETRFIYYGDMIDGWGVGSKFEQKYILRPINNILWNIGLGPH